MTEPEKKQIADVAKLVLTGGTPYFLSKKEFTEEQIDKICKAIVAALVEYEKSHSQRH